MTKDRARKRAARDRAASTGERYVVALRNVDAPAVAGGGLLHELTHRVRRVPAHVDGGLQATRRPNANANPPHTQPTHGEPRVLAGWQNRIARLFGAR